MPIRRADALTRPAELRAGYIMADRKAARAPKAQLDHSQPAEAPAAEEVAPGPDRRSETRIMTVFRLAKLSGARDELCLVRNISGSGLKAEIFSPKAVGDEVAIDF